MSLAHRNVALIVLGMHRSGTSALAGVLAMAGADPGPSLIPGVAEVNPKGFWEHQDIVAIHDNLLEFFHSSWDDERPLPEYWWQLPAADRFRDELLAVLHRDFTASPLWLLKDPRLCRLLPLWLPMLETLGVAPRFVICLRHPSEVSASLARRDGIARERASLLWLEHLLISERSTRGLPRMLITYDQLLGDWRQSLQQLGDGLAINLAIDTAAESRIEAFLEPALRHHAHGQAAHVANGPLSTLAEHIFESVINGGINAAAGHLDALQEKVTVMIENVAPWSAEIFALKKMKIALEGRKLQLEMENARLREEVVRVKKTVSWQITKPLRFLAFLWRKLVRDDRHS